MSARPYRVPTHAAAGSREASRFDAPSLGRELARCRDDAVADLTTFGMCALMLCEVALLEWTGWFWVVIACLATLVAGGVASLVASLRTRTISRHEHGLRIRSWREDAFDVRFDQVQELSLERRAIFWSRAVFALADGSRVSIPIASKPPLSRDILFEVVEPLLDRARIWVNAAEPIDLGAIAVGRAGLLVSGRVPLLRWEEIRQIRWRRAGLVIVARDGRVEVPYRQLRRLRMLAALLVARARVRWC
jgi:hypothetical protein